MLLIQLAHALLAILPLTVALPEDTGDIEGIKGYDIEPMQWEVRAFSDGPLIPMNGTVEEVVAKLRELNPDFDESIMPDHDGVLQERGNIWDGSGYDCERASTNGAVVGRINEGIAYLRRLRGMARTGPGPGNCVRVSCSYNAAIMWCNDNHVEMYLSSFGVIADGAQFLIDHCRFKWVNKILVRGTVVYHDSGWSVRVGNQRC